MPSTLFNIEKSGVRRAVQTPRRDLSEMFTPNYVGFGHVSKQDVKGTCLRDLWQYHTEACYPCGGWDLCIHTVEQHLSVPTAFL
jgi:hypothetical protein